MPESNPMIMYFPFKFSLILAVALLGFFSCKNRSVSPVSHPVGWNPDSLVIRTLAFGSCNKQWEEQAYWKTIMNDSPDLWIWMGDIIYSDTEDMEQLKYQYNIQKQHPEYQLFMDSVPIVGIWDDHDYGVNDGGREYLRKKESRDLLFEFLDLDPSDPAWDREGAYQAYTLGPAGRQVKLYLLDGRYFRDPLAPDTISGQRYLPNGTGAYLGEAQWDWLENEFSTSTAQVNIMVSGIQVIPEQHDFEKWNNFPTERSRLFALIKESRIQNPVFLSGDRHIGEISVYEMDDGSTFYEVTSSGLTHSYEKADEENKYRVGPLIPVKNYGIVGLDWSGEQVEVTLKIKSVSGETLSELQF
jgi:alkaline phosphatase D